MILVIPRDQTYSKCVSSLLQVSHTQLQLWPQVNVQVRARGGRPILVCEAGDTETIALSPHCLQVKFYETLLVSFHSLNPSLAPTNEMIVLCWS